MAVHFRTDRGRPMVLTIGFKALGRPRGCQPFKVVITYFSYTIFSSYPTIFLLIIGILSLKSLMTLPPLSHLLIHIIHSFIASLLLSFPLSPSFRPSFLPSFPPSFLFSSHLFFFPPFFSIFLPFFLFPVFSMPGEDNYLQIRRSYSFLPPLLPSYSISLSYISYLCLIYILPNFTNSFHWFNFFLLLSTVIILVLYLMPENFISF